MTASFLGVFLSILVYVVICVLNDAYMPLKEKPVFYFVLFGIVLAANLFVAIWSYRDGVAFITDGMLNYHCMNPAIVIIFSILIAVLAVKTIASKNAVDEA
jgi:hypothetical protein